MICPWKEFLSILPAWLANEVNKRSAQSLLELRLRLDQPPQLIEKTGSLWLNRKVTANDLNFCVNTASRYSPWSAQSSAQGYITAPGGHRIGLCGSAVVHDGCMSGIRTVRSLCIRIAHDFPGIAERYAHLTGSILIIGPPGSGKTTLLRDLIRQISLVETVAVVDERSELFPEGCFSLGKSQDVLSGCPKPHAINTLLRTMGPDTIAVDEITASEDCEALLHAGWCGVRLIATAHAAGISDLKKRPVYEPLISKRMFEHVLVVHRDKTVHEERMFP